MLATHQLRTGEPLLGSGAPLPAGRVVPAGSVLVPAGPFTLGVDGDTEPWSLDNERPAHTVDLPAFRIARVPVSNGEWQAFIDAGGYDQPQWWSDGAGSTASTPVSNDRCSGRPDGSRRRFGNVEEIPFDEPVQHVCFFEAEAYAAWAGARLPTEQEWEKACAWDPVSGTPAPVALGRLGVDTGAGQPRRGRAASGAGGRLRDGCVGLRRRADDRRRLGVDRRRGSRRGPGSSRCSTPTTAHRSSAVTSRCCAAVRGRSVARRSAPPSATGTCRSGGRSSPACDWPGIAWPGGVAGHV